MIKLRKILLAICEWGLNPIGLMFVMIVLVAIFMPHLTGGNYDDDRSGCQYRGADC